MPVDHATDIRRTLTGVILGALIIAVLAVRGWPLLFVILIVCALGLWEFFTLFWGPRGRIPSRLCAIALGWGMLILSWMHRPQDALVCLGAGFVLASMSFLFRWDVIEEDQIPHIEAVFSLTDFHVVFEREGKVLARFVENITKNYRAKYPSGFRISDIKYADVPNDQVVLLNYTSGTTGHSKGVMLTVNNLTANVEFALQAVNRNGELYFGKGVRTLSFLPLAHADGCAFDRWPPEVT